MRIFVGVIAILLVLSAYTMSRNTDVAGTDSLLARSNIHLDNTYSNEKFGFSLKYPSDYDVVLKEGIGDKDVIVISKKDSSTGMQIEIQKVDEDISALTAERIKMDLPSMVIDEPASVIVGGKGRGTSFLSDEETFGVPSREVWFINDRVLYQVRAPSDVDDLVKAVLSTWTFK